MIKINRYSAETYKLEVNSKEFYIISYSDCKITAKDYELNILKKQDGKDDAEFHYLVKNDKVILNKIKTRVVNKLVIDNVEQIGVKDSDYIIYDNISHIIYDGTIVVGRGMVQKFKYPYSTIFDYEKVFVIQISLGKVVSVSNISGSVQYLRDEEKKIVDLESSKKIFSKLPKDEMKTVRMVCNEDDYYEYALM